jgi:hypothetical protein
MRFFCAIQYGAPTAATSGNAQSEARNPTSALCFFLRPIKPFEGHPAWVTRSAACEYEDQSARR